MPTVDVSAIETRVTAKNVDFSNCDRELVQFPGAIQPHGVMLVVDEPDYIIRQASANCHALLGRGPEELIGRSITELFGDAHRAAARSIAQGLARSYAGPCGARVFRRFDWHRESTSSLIAATGR